MRPQWFAAPKGVGATSTDALPIPYDTMWADDIYWMPLMLAGKRFVGRADFQKAESGKEYMRRWWFGTPS
jgi:8-oxo-dGTP diphosphatase/2-hydroxy-dATP diphosphatase